MLSSVRFAIAAVALAMAAPAANAATGLPFLPHQALYDLSLQKTRSSTTLENARGRILYKFTGSTCEGYNSDFRQVVELDNGEGKTTLTDLRSTSWEEGTGKSYRFKIETRMDGVDPQPVDGIAEHDGDKVTVKLKLPATKTFTIDGSVVFPTEHIRRIIDAALAGKSVLELPVFDGSGGGEKVYNTLSVIGQAIPADRPVAAPDPAAANAELQAMKRWPVSVSYYDRDAKKADGEQTPLYAMSFELYENGVSRALVLDYNDYVVAGAMTRYDPMTAKPCK